MRPPPAARFDALLDECAGVLAAIGARVADRLGDPTGDVERGDVGDAARLLRSLRDAARVARVPEGSLSRWTAPAEGLPTGGAVLAAVSALPVTPADACPACGSAEVGTVESVPGVALGRISDGRMEWSGQTEIDWNGSETLVTPEGVALACAACGERWVHPSLVVE